MSKTNHRVNVEEVEREGESPAHRKRREVQQSMRDLTKRDLYDDEDTDDLYEFETFERIRPKHKR